MRHSNIKIYFYLTESDAFITTIWNSGYLCVILWHVNSSRLLAHNEITSISSKKSKIVVNTLIINKCCFLRNITINSNYASYSLMGNLLRKWPPPTTHKIIAIVPSLSFPPLYHIRYYGDIWTGILHNANMDVRVH